MSIRYEERRSPTTSLIQPLESDRAESRSDLRISAAFPIMKPWREARGRSHARAHLHGSAARSDLICGSAPSQVHSLASEQLACAKNLRRTLNRAMPN